MYNATNMTDGFQYLEDTQNASKQKVSKIGNLNRERADISDADVTWPW